MANNTSAPTFFPNSTAYSNAPASSGFGDLTVEKSPSGTACSSTTCKPLKFACSNAFSTSINPVPCNGVYTTDNPSTSLRSFGFTETVLISFKYASSTSFPIIVTRPDASNASSSSTSISSGLSTWRTYAVNASASFGGI